MTIQDIDSIKIYRDTATLITSDNEIFLTINDSVVRLISDDPKMVEVKKVYLGSDLIYEK